MILKIFLVLHVILVSVCAEGFGTVIPRFFRKSFELGKSALVQTDHGTHKFYSYQYGQVYTKNNIDGDLSKAVKIEQDCRGYPVVFQKHVDDDSVTLEYRLMPKVHAQNRYQFPQDFMVEVPSVWLKQNRAKHLNQVSFLGAHNCFANPEDGFLYFQQQDTIRDQFEQGGVRMLRPAWHNPSGSIIDAPNIEPILCHADDDKCATSSLASRGFQPHQTVSEFNKLLFDLLQQYPEEIIIIGINNYLTSEKTDAEIEKIPGLSTLVVTAEDLRCKKYQEERNGTMITSIWPTLDWMIRCNKRVIFLNEIETRYTIPYSGYVGRNQYGTASVSVASRPRSDDPVMEDGLFELSWFQNVSLPLHEINALQVGVELYLNLMTIIPSVFARALGVSRRVFGHSRIESYEYGRQLQYFMNIVATGKEQIGSFLAKSIIGQRVAKFYAQFLALQSAIKKITFYIPVKQDNSLSKLCRVVQACRATGVLSKTQIPNIVMLDFATTTGDGIVFVNLINMLMDRKLQLNFVGVGGFCYHGKQIEFNEI